MQRIGALVMLLLACSACSKRSEPPVADAAPVIVDPGDAAPPPPPAPEVEAAPVPHDAAPPKPRACRPKVPVVAYWPGWTMGALPAEEIAFDGLTDVVLFSLLPKGDGLEADQNGLPGSRAHIARDAARKRGVCVHVAIGGEKTAAAFAAATDQLERIVTYVERMDLDGVVLDIEPLADTGEAFVSLVRGLRPRVKTLALDIAPTKGDVVKLPALLPFLDRIDVMSYLGTPEASGETRSAIERLGFRGTIAMGATPKMPRCTGPRFFWEMGAFCKGPPRPCRVAEIGCPSP